MVATVCVFFVFQAVAFAQEGEEHHGMHGDEARMERLHKMMPMYAQARLEIIEALKKGDSATVQSEAGKILATVPNLKKAKPHKNLGRIKTMRKIASTFERDIKTTAELAKRGDIKGAGAAFAEAQKRCDECPNGT
jgi:hypothetical protein